MIRAFVVHICDDCLALRGEMCHEPDCRFCRRTMSEVADFLDALLIRPRIDGQSTLVDQGIPAIVLVGDVYRIRGRDVRVQGLADGNVARDHRKRVAVRNLTTDRLSYLPERVLLNATPASPSTETQE